MTSSTTKRGLLRRFRADTRANSALMFGLLALPFFGVLGFAADYSLGLANKSKLDGAADAAALAAINTAQAYVQANGRSTTTQALAAGTTQGLAAFQSNAGHIMQGNVPTPSITWVPSSNAQTFTAQVTYTTPVTTNFGKLFGVNTMPVSGVASATLTIPTYINYYIIVDNSQSMGVGGTTSDMTNLYNRVIQYKNYASSGDASTQTGCVFGCHVIQSGGSQSVTNEVLAHSATYGAPISLRIDYAKAAVQDILNSAISTQTSQNLVQIGVYTMQDNPQSPGTYIQKIQDPPSYTFTTTQSEVAAIDLGPNNGGGTGDTSFTLSLNTFTSTVLPTQGDGSTRAKALNYVFIVTDGLSDVPGACTSGHCTAAFNSSVCSQLQTNATVGVIYTTYNPIYLNQNNPSQGNNQNYTNLVAPYVNNIPLNLKACSTDPSQFYFEAQDGPALQAAMSQLFANAQGSASRLTQ